ncbi:MAG: FKBP-type peptidyl-prolyl cis-trans isomerase [Bacteroidaceae bacterium]|jgi:FKBP-type peptidyl-prolyl cis-trans isomerase FklB|nr:FKBP-type peptidyl-prolyl cis-trans isomerase [Paludibacteraceae bacterium]MBQ7526220.1 FKBP-type peptidyl-prolyl cis-trans isomerase [Bacteroidaceae bacterium]MBR6128927.1 FKBP-type peptidyl-prolyl cis-trans isomerase [Bacteroidaceae bacterium]
MNVRQKALLLLPALLLLLIASCKNSEKVDDPHENWKERNAQWFAEVYDAAQASIAAAKAQYPNGNDWEKHCDWRVFKTLLKSQETQGATTDYIVCKINERGDGDWSAAYTDSVRLYYRGWIMDENYPASKTNMTVFSQTYYGDFDKTTAAPLAMPVLSTVEGFMTAVQYMVKGDDWMVYIPEQLAYGSTASDAIPAYSTLLYRIRIELVHKSGTGMPGWR